MDWQTVGTITTGSNYVYTPIVTGQLFKFKHSTNSALIKSLKVVIKQSYDDNGITTFFDSKTLNCKPEQDVILFSVPRGITNRRLGIVRIDNLINEQWSIDIESLEVAQDGVNLPINISDVIDLQARLDEIQADLLEKAIESELHSHVLNYSNPHQMTVGQIGAEAQGTAVAIVGFHEETVNHPIATISNRGMMSSTDKAKLSTIAEGATVNSSDTYLLDRSKHNGVQPISTITNLVDTLLTFVKLTGSQIINGVKSFNNLIYASQQIISNSYISANEYYLGNTPLSIEIARTTTPEPNVCTDIGYFNIPNGAVSFRLTLIVSDHNFSISKAYIVTTVFGGVDRGWLKLVPIKESVDNLINNCEIDIRVFQNTTYLRIRRSGSYGDNGTAIVRVEFTGSKNTYFEPTSEVVYDTNVTGTY